MTTHAANAVLRERRLNPRQVRRLAGMHATEHWCERKEDAQSEGNPARCPLCAKEALDLARLESQRRTDAERR